MKWVPRLICGLVLVPCAACSGKTSTQDGAWSLGGATSIGGSGNFVAMPNTAGTTSAGGLIATGSTLSTAGAAATGGAAASSGGVTSTSSGGTIGGATTGGSGPVGGASKGVVAKSITAGYYHNCALLVGGRVQCWGDNSYGQLGNGTAIDRSRRSPLMASATQWRSVPAATTAAHFCRTALSSVGATTSTANSATDRRRIARCPSRSRASRGPWPLPPTENTFAPF